MDLDQLTLGQIKDLKKLFGGSKCNDTELPLDIGENYFIRTVTFYYTGKVKAIKNDAIILSKVAWIADTGRFYNFLKSGEAKEIEPFVDDVIVPIGSVIDITKWAHALPEKQK